MARSIGVSVVSEGVETREQLEFLLEEKCEYMQGYYFSKPVAAEAFTGLLKLMNKTWRKPAAPDPAKNAQALG